MRLGNGDSRVTDERRTHATHGSITLHGSGQTGTREVLTARELSDLSEADSDRLERGRLGAGLATGTRAVRIRAALAGADTPATTRMRGPVEPLEPARVARNQQPAVNGRATWARRPAKDLNSNCRKHECGQEPLDTAITDPHGAPH